MSFNMSGSTEKKLTGKITGSDRAVEISYNGAITGVDDLIGQLEVEDLVAPGFIDLQVNGFAGADYNDPTTSSESIAKSIDAIFSTGTTRIFATVITGSEERITGSLRNLVRAKEEFSRAGMPETYALEAFHIEGPNISPEDGPRGAHPLEHIRPPDLEEFKRWQEAAAGQIRLVTVSPEWETMPPYVRSLVNAGVVVSIGHTKANSEQIKAVTDAGATMSTHLGNATHPQLPKTNNYLWDQLAEDRLAGCFIVDGIHIPQNFFRSALRAKGAERCVLVTDAVMPALCEPGPYRLGQVDVLLRPDGSVVMRDSQRLAGSALSMDRAIGNSVKLGGISIATALPMATTNAARVGRIAGRLRGLVPGEKADLVRFRWDAASQSLVVKETVVAGHSVYSSDIATRVGMKASPLQ